MKYIKKIIKKSNHITETNSILVTMLVFLIAAWAAMMYIQYIGI